MKLGSHRNFALLLAGVFALFQIYAISHSASYGDAPHEHDGISCAVSAMSDDEAGVLPTPPLHVQSTEPHTTEFTSAFTSACIPSPRSRAPPPRAPPF